MILGTQLPHLTLIAWTDYIVWNDDDDDLDDDDPKLRGTLGWEYNSNENATFFFKCCCSSSFTLKNLLQAILKCSYRISIWKINI